MFANKHADKGPSQAAVITINCNKASQKLGFINIVRWSKCWHFKLHVKKLRTIQCFHNNVTWAYLVFFKNQTRKAQLSLTNPRDAKACQNCSNPTCLQRCRWQYCPIFMRLTAIASKIRKIPRNTLKIQTYGVQGHPRSSILVSIESPLCDLLLVINSNFSRICCRFRDIHG